MKGSRVMVGSGVEETAKGVGNTVVEGARYTGERQRLRGEREEIPDSTVLEVTERAWRSGLPPGLGGATLECRRPCSRHGSS